MNEYIYEKKIVLRDFLIPESVIDSIPWDRFQNEIQCDQYCRDVIMNSFGDDLGHV